MNAHEEAWSKIHVTLANTELTQSLISLLHIYILIQMFICHPYQRPQGHLIFIKCIFLTPFSQDFLSHTILPTPLAHSYIDCTLTATTFMKPSLVNVLRDSLMIISTNQYSSKSHSTTCVKDV